MTSLRGWLQARALLTLTAVFAFAGSVAWAAVPAGKSLNDLRIEQPADDAAVRHVVIELEAATSPKFFVLERPLRAVVDLPGTRARQAFALPAASGAVRALRKGPQSDGSLRLVIDLAEGAKVQWRGESSPARRFVLEVVGEPIAAASSGPAPAPVVSAPAPVASTPAPVASTPAPLVSAPVKAIKTEHAPIGGRDVVVAIDAGHGGQDPGAIGRGGTREKDVVLDISRVLAARINREPGMRAILTREGDYFLTLRQRIRKARDAGAELFVSVHADSVRDPSVSGSSVYVLSLKGATDEQARLLADRENAADLAGGVSLDDKDPVIASVLVDLAQSAQISQSMVAAERVLRSLGRVNDVRKPQVQQAGFVVLKSPDIPSMLVETAFISSPADERLLNQSERREALAEAIFDGVRQFFVDHPPDGSRFAKARESGRTVIATATDSAPARSGKL